MRGFAVHANAIVTDVDAPTRDAAIDAYVAEAGYASVAEAAAVCGQTRERFLEDIHVTTR
jgi:hypothetical protein